MPIHLHRPEEVIGLDGMRSWIREDCSDQASLVLRSDRGVTPVAERQADQAVLRYVAAHPRGSLRQSISDARRREMAGRRRTYGSEI
jgi:hypothetical protein